MSSFPWLEKLADLLAECRPDGWKFLASGDRHGTDVVVHHRHSEAKNADLYVELGVVPKSWTEDVVVTIRVAAVSADQRQGPDVNVAQRILFQDLIQPEFLPELALFLRHAYALAELLQPPNNQPNHHEPVRKTRKKGSS